MNTIFQSSTPMPANAILASGWLDLGGSGDFPFVVLSVLTDQAGTLQIYESEDKPGKYLTRPVVAGGVTNPNLAMVINANISRRFVQIIYTNGSTSQTSLALTALATATPAIAVASPEWRALDLILRELRVQSLLLQALKEPSPSTVNLPLGPNVSMN